MQDKLKSGNGKIVSLNHFKEYFNLIAKRLSINILFSIFLISLCFCNIENPQSKNNRRNFSVFSFLVYNEKSSIVTTRVGSMNRTSTGSRAILLDNDKALFVGNGAELFDPSTLSFSLVANRTLNRVRHTLTKLQDGRILILGGNIPTVEIYNSATDTFSNTGTMIQSLRSGNTATLLPNGKVLVTGGSQTNTSTTGFVSAELYDPITGVFTNTGNLNYPRYLHSATLLNDGTVLIIGGWNDRRKVTTLELYNPSTGLFTILANSSCQSSNSGNSILLADKNVFIADNLYPISLQIFDLILNNCSTINQSLYNGISDFSIASLKDGRVLLIGGVIEASSTYPDAPTTFYSRKLNVYDSNLKIVSYLGDMNKARSFAKAVVLKDGRVLITGGYPGSESRIAEIYTPTGTPQ